MTRTIGLLVVHGIGQQRRGELTSEISTHIAESVNEQTDSVSRITVQDVPVKRLVSWENYCAWSGPASGQIDHYSVERQAINNHRIRWLGPYFMSHVAYWKNTTVIDGVRARVRAK